MVWFVSRRENIVVYFLLYSLSLFIAFSGEKKKSTSLQSLSCSSFFFKTRRCLKNKIWVQSGCVGNNPNKMKLCSFITISIQVNTKVSYFFFLKKDLKCSCLPIIQASSCKSELSVAFSESSILDCSYFRVLLFYGIGCSQASLEANGMRALVLLFPTFQTSYHVLTHL